MKRGESFYREEKEKVEKVNIEEVTRRIQDIYITSAEKYLSDNEELRNAVIDYYSDTERLQKELTNVFTRSTKDEVEEKIDAIAQMFKDKDTFVNEVSKHIESFQSTTERKNSFIRRNRRMEENPIATDEEYDAGTYRDSLESQVADAVFTLRDKGYLTFESGMSESNTNREQFIGMYNKNVFIPEKLTLSLKEKGFLIFLKHFDDRTQIRIKPLDENVPLSRWKKIWDEVAEQLPKAEKENLKNIRIWQYHKEFREFQNRMRKRVNDSNSES